jgi:hypothetical protein
MMSWALVTACKCQDITPQIFQSGLAFTLFVQAESQYGLVGYKGCKGDV